MDITEIFGEPISTYSRAQAIEDGVLVDLMQDDLAAMCRQLYKYPVACTSAVWDIIDRAVKSKTAHNDLKGVVWDLLWMSRHGTYVDETTRAFKVYIVGGSTKKLHQFKIVCGPGDDAEPVLTIMLPEED